MGSFTQYPEPLPRKIARCRRKLKQTSAEWREPLQRENCDAQLLLRGGLGGGGRNRTGVHGFAGRCMTTLPPRRKQKGESALSPGVPWSGKRGSNSRPQPWQGCALPTELFPHRPGIVRRPPSGVKAKRDPVERPTTGNCLLPKEKAFEGIRQTDYVGYDAEPRVIVLAYGEFPRARYNQVSTTESGFSERLSMPSSTSHLARSG